MFLLAQAQDIATPQNTFAGAFSQMAGEHQFVLILVSVTCLTAMVIATVSIIFGVFYNLHRKSCEHELKRELLDRGMSAEEIATIIQATAPTSYWERKALNKNHLD